MITDPVRRANLGAIECEPRPQLPDGFRRSSTRVGTALGAARTGLSVYELPPGQAIGPYRYDDPEEERRACSNRGSLRTAAKSSSLRACSRKDGCSSTERRRWANVSSPVSPSSVAKHA